MSKYIRNWFSNMEKCESPIKDDFGLEYMCVENYYQAAKSLDKNVRKQFQSVTPFEAKKMGKNVEMRIDWNFVKLQIMEDALRQKFALGTKWCEQLLAEQGEIVEWNNWHDLFWGKDIVTKEGENHLGIILMQLRDELSRKSLEDRKEKYLKKIGYFAEF